MKGGIWFIIGCFVGSVVTQVWLDRHSSDGKPEEKKEEPKDANPKTGETEPNHEPDEEKPRKEKKEGFREQTSIDGYEAPLAEERTAYEKIIRAEYDPAEDESPTDEDSLESLHEEAKNKPPREISEKEYGNFGYQCDSLYYDKDFDVLMYDDETEEAIDDPQDVYRIVGDVLKHSPFKNDDSMTELYIRNYRLRTDYVIYKK